MEEKFRKAMVTNASMDNEKSQLMFQVRKIKNVKLKSQVPCPCKPPGSQKTDAVYNAMFTFPLEVEYGFKHSLFPKKKSKTYCFLFAGGPPEGPGGGSGGAGGPGAEGAARQVP